MDNRTVNSLLEKYGSPLYVFQEKEFRENFTHLCDAMRKYYPKYIPAYSYKTNYTPFLCKLVKQMGGYAEVVSDMEYLVAKKLGYEESHIIYNGPVKESLMEDFLLKGGIVNIDNLTEAKRIIRLANANPSKDIHVGLRLNVDVGQGFISRFGIDADSSDVDAVLSVLSNSSNIDLMGIHMHVGRTRGVEPWHTRAVKMIELADKIFKGRTPKFIDLGSGMFGDMEESLAKQFGDNIPTYEDYAEAVAKTFAERYGSLPENEQPILFTEPGTTVASRYCDFLATVQNIKEIRGQQIVALDCSMYNIGGMCRMLNLPLKVLHNGGATTALNNANFVGFTCLEYDVMYKGFTGDLAEGDTVVFGNVGGYSNVDKAPFIYWNCPMIVLHEDGSSSVIKDGECFDDIFHTYHF